MTSASCITHCWLIWRRFVSRDQKFIRVRCWHCRAKETWPARNAYLAQGDYAHMLAQQRRGTSPRRVGEDGQAPPEAALHD